MSYSRDWSGSREHWPELFALFAADVDYGFTILEVGCYEGQATRWFLDKLPAAAVDVVDPFAFPAQLATFTENVPELGTTVRAFIGLSQETLPELFGATYDLVYLDGSHETHDVLSDAVDAIRLVRPRGWILFDDYDFTGVTPGVVPAVDAFVSCYRPLLAGAKPVGRDQFLVVKQG